MSINLPSTCVLCGDSAPGPVALCRDCSDDLPWQKVACIRCAQPLPAGDCANCICGECLKSSSPVDYTRSALSYHSPVDFLVSRLKFNHQLAHAAILSDLLYRYLTSARTDEKYAQTVMPDLIIPVPLHNKRLSQRGFNQATEITRSLSKKLQVPMCSDSVVRIRETRPQTELDAAKRRSNIKGSFELSGKGRLWRYKHVVILDDVITTGATCNELAIVLKRSGVDKVGVWSIARA